MLLVSEIKIEENILSYLNCFMLTGILKQSKFTVFLKIIKDYFCLF